MKPGGPAKEPDMFPGGGYGARPDACDPRGGNEPETLPGGPYGDEFGASPEAREARGATEERRDIIVGMRSSAPAI